MVAEAILEWYKKEGRDLPWRHTTDPYAILVSEIMLQQTQVDRVILKWEAWLRAFPDWQELASASRADILRYWSGLGYNNRAVRLHALAKLVHEELGGVLPETEEELQELPGIGSYTAGAIMAFAYDRPGKCVDVNIERLMRRLFFSISKRNIMKQELEAMFIGSYPEEARDYANALMDLGSAICTPTNPRCAECPVHDECKSKGERREEEGLRAKKKQPTFKHSNRWYRGKILKNLTDEPYTESELWQIIDGEWKDFRKALRQLREEDLVHGSEKLHL